MSALGCSGAVWGGLGQGVWGDLPTEEELRSHKNRQDTRDARYRICYHRRLQETTTKRRTITSVFKILGAQIVGPEKPEKSVSLRMRDDPNLCIGVGWDGVKWDGVGWVVWSCGVSVVFLVGVLCSAKGTARHESGVKEYPPNHL